MVRRGGDGPPMELMGMESVKCVIKNGKWGQWLKGFKDCPGFLNSTGRLGPKRGRKCYITPAFSGVPNKGNKIGSQNLRRGSP